MHALQTLGWKFEILNFLQLLKHILRIFPSWGVGQLNFCGLVCSGSQFFDSKYIQHKLLLVVLLSNLLSLFLLQENLCNMTPTSRDPFEAKAGLLVVVTCFIHHVMNVSFSATNKQYSKHTEINTYMLKTLWHCVQWILSNTKFNVFFP